MTEIAWHYTLGDRAAEYRLAGLIQPEAEGFRRPFVWFSTRQDWEPMHTRYGTYEDGTGRYATLEEMASGQDGLWRFGVSTSALLPWGSLREAAHMRQKMLRALLLEASKCGADPYSWYGSIEPVRLEQCIIQCRMSAADEWGRAGRP